MSSSKKIVLKKAGVYLSEAQNPIPSPLHNLYVYSVYFFSRREGGEVNGSWTREKGRGAQSWVEITNMTEFTQEIGYLQSINSHKHLLQSPFTGQFF